MFVSSKLHIMRPPSGMVLVDEAFEGELGHESGVLMMGLMPL